MTHSHAACCAGAGGQQPSGMHDCSAAGLSCSCRNDLCGVLVWAAQGACSKCSRTVLQLHDHLGTMPAASYCSTAVACSPGTDSGLSRCCCICCCCCRAQCSWRSCVTAARCAHQHELGGRVQ